jgi:hypothetical protein
MRRTQSTLNRQECPVGSLSVADGLLTGLSRRFGCPSDAMAAQRKRTIRLYRVNEDERRLLADTIEAGSSAELAVLWRAFLATAAWGTYSKVCLTPGSCLTLAGRAEGRLCANRTKSLPR